MDSPKLEHGISSALKERVPRPITESSDEDSISKRPRMCVLVVSAHV